MNLPLPRLDDRRWADLVDEARGLLPLHAPGWTDHNIHDPGITLLELFAWQTEQTVFRIDRIPIAQQRRFLALVGVVQHPPEPATGLLRLRHPGGSAPVAVPASSIWTGIGADAGTSMRTRGPLTVQASDLVEILQGPDEDLEDLSEAWQDGAPLLPFGSDPRPGATLHLGFDRPLSETPLSIAVQVSGGGAAARRALHEASRLPPSCRAPDPACAAPAVPPENEPDQSLPVHHSVRLRWEVATGPGSWTPLEVDDDSRAFTLDGVITVHVDQPTAALVLGESATPRHWLRCRLLRGTWEAAPVVRALVAQAVPVEQAAPPPLAIAWPIRPGATVAVVPVPGESLPLRLVFDAAGGITALAQEPDAAPVTVLGFTAPSGATAGELRLAAVRLGIGTGRPDQTLDLPQPLVADRSCRVWTIDAAGPWRAWTQVADLAASRRDQTHFQLSPPERDPDLARLRFGDGERGLVLPPGATVLAAWDASLGSAAALGAGSVARLAEHPLNDTLIGDPTAIAALSADLPIGLDGGTDGESLAAATARARQLVVTTDRTVTLADHERLALETPGVVVARATALGGHHACLPCIHARGVVTVVVLPRLPSAAPSPSRALLHEVARHLRRGRLLGTRIEVVGPHYVPVLVEARVRACPGSDRQALVRRLRQGLDDFLHPLRGGPDSAGWPFGRAVLRNEVLERLAAVSGSDVVLELRLFSGCQESCGNLCLPPTGLPRAGAHRITVLEESS